MTTGRNRSALSYIPGLTNNGVLKLILFLSVAYVMLALVWGVMMLVYQDGTNFNVYFIPNIAMAGKGGSFTSHVWTLLTYGIFNFPNNFWELISNMLWLYCFASVVQMLVGPKQIIPLYLYCVLAGGVFYLLGQALPGELGKSPAYIMGPRAGLMGLAAAAVTLSPRYRFYLTETFTIPLLAVAGVFTVLMILASGFYLPVVIMIAGGGLAGFGYIKALQAGYRPAHWMYAMTSKIARTVTPDEDAEWKRHNKKRTQVFNQAYEPKNGVSQKRIDEILDKINQKGYNALSADEREVLLRAGKE
jgi:membrane associated rhomboid family serine protease